MAGRTRRAGAWFVPVCLAALVAGGLASTEPAGGSSAAAKSGRPPNILVITVDDQATNSFRRRYMPDTFDAIVDPGTRFKNGIAAPPLCCPDRAGFLTGQYPHNSGVWSNKPGYKALQDPGNTLPVWLHEAGYRTGLIGKYLNHYETYEGLQPAPGFDRWFAFADSDYYYEYDVSDNGVPVHYDSARRDYSTFLLTREAKRFVSAPGGQPFFLWLTYNAPHSADNVDQPPCGRGTPTVPDEATYDAVKGFPLPKPPSFNERNVADKPLDIQSLPPLDNEAVSAITHRWDCTLGAMAAVDRSIGRLVQTMRDEGLFRRTIVVYVSDNGFMFGEQRVRRGKAEVYEPSLRVPYAMRVPTRYQAGIAPRAVGPVVSNEDLAPTLLDYADDYVGAAPCPPAPGECRRMDGRSLRPLLGDGGSWPADRGVLAEIDDANTSTYQAIRTRGYLYNELPTDERELYNLRFDPYELRNRAFSPEYTATQAQLQLRLMSLEQCSGVEGRDPPSAVPFCE